MLNIRAAINISPVKLTQMENARTHLRIVVINRNSEFNICFYSADDVQNGKSTYIPIRTHMQNHNRIFIVEINGLYCLRTNALMSR